MYFSVWVSYFYRLLIRTKNITNSKIKKHFQKIFSQTIWFENDVNNELTSLFFTILYQKIIFKHTFAFSMQFKYFFFSNIQFKSSDFACKIKNFQFSAQQRRCHNQYINNNSTTALKKRWRKKKTPTENPCECVEGEKRTRPTQHSLR